MKKILVLISFLIAAACLLTAALYINRKNAGMIEYVEEKSDTVRDPELLSEIKLGSYVSLPAAFETISIEEEIKETNISSDNVEEVMYDQLLSTAHHLEKAKENTLLLVNFTITKEGNFVTRENDYWMSFRRSKVSDDQVYKTISEMLMNEPVRMTDVNFEDYENVTVDIEITDIIDMPYPVTDQYVDKNTEYSSVADMQAKLLQQDNRSVKTEARENTLDSLVDVMIRQTTFVSAPESLIQEEFEVLKKENPDAIYSDAQKSIYRILFIAAMIEKYKIASVTDMQKRFEALPLEERSQMTDYEVERTKYLLFEEEVVMFIYKKVQIN